MISKAIFEQGNLPYVITDVDLWEQDAIIEINGIKFYFQFSNEEGPTLAEALHYLLQQNTTV